MKYPGEIISVGKAPDYGGVGYGYIFEPEAQRRGGYEPTPVGENAIDCNAGGVLVELLEKV